MISILLVGLAVVLVLVTVTAVVGWRRLGGRKLARRARFLVAEETARSGPHQAVVRWRRVLAEALDQTRAAFEVARRSGAPMSDLFGLLPPLERSVAGLDQELVLLSGEPDPRFVDHTLRTDIGLRADQVLQIAGQLRRAVTSSVSSGSAEGLNALATSADISTRALAAALDELSPRPRG